MKASVKIQFDAQGVKNRIAAQTRRAQLLLDQQVMKDSNLFCPRDVGSLQDSVIPSASRGEGLLVWNEIYAHAQYYGLPNKSKDKNPRASMKWFEVAKARYLNRWVKLV